MKIVFHSGRELDYFPDIIEYIRYIKKMTSHEVCFVGYSNSKSGKSYFQELDITTYYVDNGKTLRQRLENLYQIFSDLKPDILHVFHYRGCITIPFLVLNQKTKCILDVRTIAVEDKNGNPNKGLSLFFKDRLTWVESLSYFQSVALTPTIQRKLKPSKRKVPIIPLGGNMELFKTCLQPENKEIARKELSINNGQTVILYSGVLTPSRNMEIPIRAICRALGKLNNVICMILGGSNFDDYMAKLKGIPKEYNVSEKVRFVGKKPYNEISKYYAASDIGISFTPADSAYATQPPTKILEYLMSGMLVVSNRTPAVEEIVDENSTAFLSDDSITEFEAALLNAIHKSEQKNISVSKEAANSVSHLSWSKIVKNKLLPFYEQL